MKSINHKPATYVPASSISYFNISRTSKIDTPCFHKLYLPQISSSNKFTILMHIIYDSHKIPLRHLRHQIIHAPPQAKNALHQLNLLPRTHTVLSSSRLTFKYRSCFVLMYIRFPMRHAISLHAEVSITNTSTSCYCNHDKTSNRFLAPTWSGLL